MTGKPLLHARGFLPTQDRNSVVASTRCFGKSVYFRAVASAGEQGGREFLLRYVDLLEGDQVWLRLAQPAKQERLTPHDALNVPRGYLHLSNMPGLKSL